LGRNAMPIDLLEANGRKHLTKAEIAARKKAEIKFGSHSLACPLFVKVDPLAFAKWKEITKLYKQIDFVSSGDAGHLARYCKAHSEYCDLISRRNMICQMESFSEEEEDVVVGEFSTHMAEMAAKKMWQKVEYIMSTSGILQIDKAINAKMQSLMAMEDRLFLNPLAKIKNVPKKEDEPPEDPNKDMFGG
jgi:phage terminase small subunit